ncbi:MAG: type II secretion system protein [Candidatus Omnitrophica bacterium]|nr:type II secretion system protein [Candidatus Omnitrophota bacterium]
MKARMNEKGFTLVEILIALGIVASLTAVALPNILRMRSNANDVAAKAAIRTIAYAAEEYAVRHGRYPIRITELTQANPPYLSEDYTANSQEGYTFTCNWSSTEYSCTATPIAGGITGNKIYTMASGIVQGETLTAAIITDNPDVLDAPISLAKLDTLLEEKPVSGTNTTTTPTDPGDDPIDDPGIIIILDDLDRPEDDGTPVTPDGMPVVDPTDPNDVQAQSAIAEVNGI